MEKSRVKTLKRIAMILAILSGLVGCKFYKKSEISRNPPGTYFERPFSPSPSTNNYVVHMGGNIMKLVNVVINKKEKTISGWAVPFEGLEKTYYDKSLPGIVERRKGGETNRKAIMQVHLHVTLYSIHNEQLIVIKFEDISKIEVLESADGLNFFVGFVSTVAITAAVLVVFLAIACGCPHVYVDNGQAYEINTTLFTGAAASRLERHDYKALPDYFKDSSSYKIKIINEEDENQFTNMLELVAVYHPLNTQVFADKDGSLHTIVHAAAPFKAVDNSFRNVLATISGADTEAYSFNSDSTKGLDDLTMSFDKPKEATQAKLVLRVKNTSWSAFVYDEFNALFGSKYEEWIKRNKNKPKEERLKWMNEQGINLQVEVKTKGEWVSTDVVELVGGVNYNSLVIPLTLTPGESSVDIRLRAGFMFWELDQATIDFSEDLPLDIQRFSPSIAKGNNGEDFRDALKADDAIYMEHLGKSGSAEIKFGPIRTEANKTRTILLHSKGYYINNGQYSGKVQRDKLAAFRRPGELSRFSKQLYEKAKGDLVIIE